MIDFLVSNTFARISFLTILFAAVMFGTLGLINFGTRRAAIRAELKGIAQQGSNNPGQQLIVKKDSAWAKLVDSIEKAGLDLTDTAGDKIRNKLIAAGFESSAAPRIFTLIRLLLTFCLPALYLLLVKLAGQQVGPFKLYIYGMGLALIGLYLPNLFITARGDRRRQKILNGFPDCLDLMLVCVEAGLGLEAAMDRVSREMVMMHPLVAKQLSTATLKMRAGAGRESALRAMGEASGVEEIRSFATLLIQSDKLGTSIGSTLRIYAREMREKRRLRAEEKAHRLPVVISIPLVVCLLPTMVGVLMLPGIVRVIRELLPALAGG